jgi:hypothetical protein
VYALIGGPSASPTRYLNGSHYLPLLGEALGPPISAYTYFGRGTVGLSWSTNLAKSHDWPKERHVTFVHSR